MQVLIRDEGKQKPGTFGQRGRGQRAGHERIGIRQQPGKHHEENGGKHARLDQTEDPAHKPVKPAEKREAHHLFEHKAQAHDPEKDRKKKQGIGHEKTELGRGNHRGKTRADLLVITPGKKIAEDERGQGGELADEADPDAANKKEENDGDNAKINCIHGWPFCNNSNFTSNRCFDRALLNLAKGSA